jgi:hypothetical protein
VGAKHLDVCVDSVVAALTTLCSLVLKRTPRFKVDGGTFAENQALQNIQVGLRAPLTRTDSAGAAPEQTLDACGERTPSRLVSVHRRRHELRSVQGACRSRLALSSTHLLGRTHNFYRLPTVNTFSVLFTTGSIVGLL